MNLTAEQQNVVRCIVKDVKKGEKQEVSLSGWAGCGKTTCISFLSKVFDNFAICAFTGKACQVLRKKGMQASTIHSLIYKPVTLPNGKVEFYLKDRFDLVYDGFIVDEASMLSKVLYEDLLTFGLPIIFVGDHGQLEPVGQDINVMADPMYKLETIHRNAGEIAFFAEHIRKGNKPRTFHSKDKVIFVEPSKVTDEIMLSVDQMICAYNRTRVEKNQIVRELKGYIELVEQGERIMCLRNNKKSGLFNGMQGIVTKIHKGAKIDFSSDDITYLDIVYDPNQFGKEKPQFEFGMDTPDPFDYAHTCTCHKYQGSEADNVLVFEQECDKWDHKRWAYTAASRAKEQLIWVSQKRYCPTWLK
jgi:exodeoxyribonuclease-5